MREENTERKYPKSKTDGIPKKERKHRRIRAGKKKKYFQAKAFGNRKSFVFQRCAKSCLDLHLEKKGRDEERERRREGIHLWARQIAQLSWKRAVTRHDSHNPPDCQTAL